jgi:hypothetical protein
MSVAQLQRSPSGIKYEVGKESGSMNPQSQNKLNERVTRAAETALAVQDYVSAIDVLAGIGWLDHSALKRWQLGQIACLEESIQTNPSRVSEAMKLFRLWATVKGLSASETDYVARTPARQPLRFSRSGEPAIEKLYRTHWMSSELSEKKREKLAEKVSRAPELVVIKPLDDAWSCHRCKGTGNLLIMEEAGPSCLRCAGLGDLEFLPAGEPLLTRRAKAKSTMHAVVVRFSRTRRRYERQGLLVQPGALAEAQRELDK